MRKTKGLAKRLTFTEESDYQDIVLGIATDVKSWKLSYELNQILEIQLRNTSSQEPSEGKSEQNQGPPDLGITPEPFAAERYEDLETIPGIEFVVYSKDPQKLPADSRPFRFFLLIRSVSAPPPEADELMRRLLKAPVIHSTVNFSDHKHLQHLLP